MVLSMNYSRLLLRLSNSKISNNRCGIKRLISSQHTGRRQGVLSSLFSCCGKSDWNVFNHEQNLCGISKVSKFASSCAKSKVNRENTRSYMSKPEAVPIRDDCEVGECDNESVKDPLIHHERRRYSPLMQRTVQNSANFTGASTRRSLLDTMSQHLTVCVEGNIGSGKTTFLKHFKKFSEVNVFDEPISKWRDCQGYNLLDLMYKDPRKWSLCFQSYVQLTMLDLHTKPVVQPIKMMERSIYSAQYCFVKNMRDEGLMDEPQYAVLSEWFNFATSNLPLKLDLIVYLRTDPEIAHRRIGQRGRSEENSIKLEYLQKIHNLHEDWLINNPKLPCPVLTIDANLELEDMASNYLLCEEKMFKRSTVANG